MSEIEAELADLEGMLLAETDPDRQMRLALSIASRRIELEASSAT